MIARKNRYNQTLLEEIANSISHGLGLALSVVGFTVLIFLASQSGDPWRLTAYIVYGTSLTTLYLFSTLYHGLTHSRTKAIFRRLDHSAIYLLKHFLLYLQRHLDRLKLRCLQAARVH